MFKCSKNYTDVLFIAFMDKYTSIISYLWYCIKFRYRIVSIVYRDIYVAYRIKVINLVIK